MSGVNLFSRLRALLPPPPVWVAQVLAHNTDGTSTVELPAGTPGAQVSPELSTGTTLRVRGTQVAVGLRAFIRAGVIEGPAPTGPAAEAVVGVVAALPFGPERLAAAGVPAPPAAAVGVAYSYDLAPFWSGGYEPRAYALTAGVLPAGLALSATTGVISGTRSATGTAAGLVVTCTDSTHRTAASAAFSISSS